MQTLCVFLLFIPLRSLYLSLFIYRRGEEHRTFWSTPPESSGRQAEDVKPIVPVSARGERSPSGRDQTRLTGLDVMRGERRRRKEDRKWGGKEEEARKKERREIKQEVEKEEKRGGKGKRPWGNERGTKKKQSRGRKRKIKWRWSWKKEWQKEMKENEMRR